MNKLKLNIQLFASSLTLTRTQIGEPDIENNTTTERITATITRTSGSTYWQHPYERNLHIVCDGQTYDVLTELPSNVSSVSYSHDFVIEHNEDGTKTINFSGLINATQSLPELYAEGTATLTPIDRQSLKIKINSSWKNCTPYIFINGNWKRCTAYKFINGNWKKGK